MSHFSKGRKSREYKLDDGTTITVQGLLKVLAKGTCINTAWNRLQNSSDPKVVYRKVNSTRGSSAKVYTLDDGTKWTMVGLAKHLGIKKATAGARLCLTSDPAKVLAPLRKVALSEEEIEMQKDFDSRMYFDPDGFWSLFNRIS
jgi:hypothetical protein